MKAIRTVYALVAVCAGLALAYTPSAADAAAAGPKCYNCVLYPDGSTHCEYCVQEPE